MTRGNDDGGGGGRASRLGWLAAVTAAVILVPSQLLYATNTHGSCADALFESAMAITGAGLTPTTPLARIHVLLAAHSVVVFSTLAR